MGRVHAANILLAAALWAGAAPGAVLARSAASGTGSVGGASSNISYGPPASSAAAGAVSSAASSMGTAGGAPLSASGANAQALANEAVSGFGGGGMDAGSVTTSIDTLNVETGPVQHAPCAAYRSVIRRLAVHAVCRDAAGALKSPISLRRERLLPLEDKGDIFRCRGAETLSFRVVDDAQATPASQFSPSPAKDGEGRCRAGEALYHDGEGALVCRPSSGGGVQRRQLRSQASAEAVIALEAPGAPVCIAVADASASARP